MDAITLLMEENRRIERLLDAVSHGVAASVPIACDVLLRRVRIENDVLYPAVAPLVDRTDYDVPSTLADLESIRAIAMELARVSSTTPSILARAETLASLWREHAQEQERSLFPSVTLGMGPDDLRELGVTIERAQRAGGRTGAAGPQDPGASSDGDTSWAEAPMTQDPRVDRSVDAVIRRTGGL